MDNYMKNYTKIAITWAMLLILQQMIDMQCWSESANNNDRLNNDCMDCDPIVCFIDNEYNSDHSIVELC